MSTTRPLELIVRGNDYDDMKRYAAKVFETIKKAQGTTDVKTSDEEGNIEVLSRDSQGRIM